AWFASRQLVPVTLQVSASGRYVRVDAQSSQDALLVDLEQLKPLDDQDASLTNLGLTREQGAAFYRDWLDPVRTSPGGTRVARRGRGGGVEIVAADGSMVLATSPLRPISAIAGNRHIGGLYEVRLVEGDRCHVLAPHSSAIWARFLPDDR